MFVIHRSHIATKFTLLAAAAGAAVITGLTQALAADLPAFTCTDKSGGTAGVSGTVTSIRFAHHDGYDRLVIGFATSLPVPEYDLRRQASSTFSHDASGLRVTLQGSAGIRTVLHDSDIADGVPGDLKPGFPEIREVANVGDFERVVSYGIGLTNQACFRVIELTGPSRLVIDVQTPPDSGASTPVSHQSVAANPTPATSVSSLAITGSSPSPLAGEGRGGGFAMILGLAVLAAGLALGGLRRLARK